MKNLAKPRKFYYGDAKFGNVSKIAIGSAGLLALAAIAAPSFINPQDVSATCTDGTCNTPFQVNVAESLTVSINSADVGASGDVSANGTFLRNKISVSVTSNNANGFKVSMRSKDTTNLVNAANNTVTIPTLSSSSARSSFPVNKWGYSVNDDDSNSGQGTDSSTYSAMSTNAISLFTASAGTYSGSEDVYFGAKADLTQQSGSYLGVVIIDVVTGVINENPGTNPTTPEDPATPNPTPNTASYSTSGVGSSTQYSGTTTYTTVSRSNGRTTTTTQVSGGDNRDAYSSAQGVTDRTISSISEGSSSTSSALAVVSTVAATSGIFFFILAKRRADDEEEEEY